MSVYSVIFSTILLNYRQIFILRQFCFEIIWKIDENCGFSWPLSAILLLDQNLIGNNSHAYFFLFRFDSWDEIDQFWYKNHQNRLSGSEVTPVRVGELITYTHTSKYFSSQYSNFNKIMDKYNFPYFHRIATVKCYNFDI